MGEALAHRGPDGGGFYTDGPLGFGMRRLSIIDLKTGDQPMANEDKSVWVVFNGEIYNYRELTAELIQRGHRFTTASDTEVLVHLYEEFGESGVERLRGMFAFAIWDARRRSLLLARDRLGIKPLYYATTPQGLVFGSELKAVVANSWVGHDIDPQAIAGYLQYWYVADPLSILRAVQKLPPGHTTVVTAGCPAPPRRYWEPTELFRQPRFRITEEAAAEELHHVIAGAVRSHMVSDVPVGAFLSGGIDSTAVVAAMVAEAGSRLKTFSIGFKEAGYDESPFARRVAERFGTEHHELMVDSLDLDVLERVLDSIDEPFADSSAIPTYLVSRLARQHVKVVLSGDGGDELFAGYDRYLVDLRRRRTGLLGDLGLGAPLRAVSGLLPEGAPGKNYLYNISLSRIERYRDDVSLFPERTLHAFLKGGVISSRDSAFMAAVRDGEGLDPLSRLQALDLRTYLPGDILTKLDRMSMAHSLEARVPLLDHILVEYACRLPVNLRIRNGVTKSLLRRTLRDRVPDEVLTRPKQGFAVPLLAWTSKHLPGFFRDRLGNADRLAEVGIDRNAVGSLLALFERRLRQDHCHRLWALAVLDGTLRRLNRVTS